MKLARLREKPVAAIAKDLGISESCLRNWMSRADVDEGRKAGLSTDERAELVRLRRELRVKEMAYVDVLPRTSGAYFGVRSRSGGCRPRLRRAHWRPETESKIWSATRVPTTAASLKSGPTAPIADNGGLTYSILPPAQVPNTTDHNSCSVGRIQEGPALDKREFIKTNIIATCDIGAIEVGNSSSDPMLGPGQLEFG